MKICSYSPRVLEYNYHKYTIAIIAHIFSGKAQEAFLIMEKRGNYLTIILDSITERVFTVGSKKNEAIGETMFLIDSLAWIEYLKREECYTYYII